MPPWMAIWPSSTPTARPWSGATGAAGPSSSTRAASQPRALTPSWWIRGLALRLYTASADSLGPMALVGAADGVTTTEAGENARRTFNGVAGQHVSLNMTNASVDRYLAILNPDGSTLVGANWCCGAI